MKQTKLLEKIIKKYELKDEQIIKKGELQQIANEEKIELKDVIYILGCYYGILYKDERKWTKINLNKKRDIREKIKLIKIDLRYLEGYGERSYTKIEIEKICKEYEVSLEDFITYVNRYKICYYENMELLIRNKNGIWIGRAPALSSKFIENHFDMLKQRIEVISKKIDNIYNIGIQEELFDFGIDRILKRGDIENNLSFDEERIIGKLLYRAKFDMIDYSIRYMKRFKTNVKIDNIKCFEQYEENTSIQEWLYPIKFDLTQRLIIQEIIRRIYDELETRTNILNSIYKKLGMKKIEFYNELYNIQKLMINFNKAKICSNGRIIINEQV